jgi:hypothetical protein
VVDKEEEKKCGRFVTGFGRVRGRVRDGRKMEGGWKEDGGRTWFFETEFGGGRGETEGRKSLQGRGKDGWIFALGGVRAGWG